MRMVDHSKIKSIKSTTVVSQDDGLNSFYIIEYLGGGFAILSADKRTPAVLAYSPSSYFPTDTVPLGVNIWLSERQEEIEHIRSANLPYTGQDKITPFRNVLVNETNDNMPFNIPAPDPGDLCEEYIIQTGPLLQTTWNQIGGYNNMMPLLPSCALPMTNNGRAFTGCVATAMAQVMRFHQHPNTYNYAIMPNAVQWFDTNPSAMAVSQLMLDAAESVNASYGCEATGAASDLQDIVNAFKNTFNYASTVTKGDFDRNTVINEIRFGNRPVILTGYTTRTGLIFYSYKGGHAWVADGYRVINWCPDPLTGEGGGASMSFYMNWGWGDNDFNGWFSTLSANSGNGNFQYKREMVIGIKP